MIDARVDDALKSHEKKVLWQMEQEDPQGNLRVVTPAYRSSKDTVAFTPPQGKAKSQESSSVPPSDAPIKSPHEGSSVPPSTPKSAPKNKPES